MADTLGIKTPRVETPETHWRDTDEQQKEIVGIVARNSVDYIDKVFDALEANKVVVPLRREDDEERAQPAGVTERVVPSDGHGWIKRSFTPSKSEDIAQISFTSGTEGAPKGVMLSHRALTDALERIQNIMSLTGDVREYIGVPVYHSFGYGRCRVVCSVGGQAYIPPNGFNPSEISTMLREGEINALSAVPSLLRVLLKNKSIFGAERKQLRWIEIGSQPMSAAEKIALRELFPNACIVQHYGLTEASRTTLLRIDGTDEKYLESVGRAEGSVSLKIGEEGRINIKGRHLASGLLIQGEQAPLPGADGWFETSDLGRLEDGYLYFEGRADNVINCGGQKVSAENLEDALRHRTGAAGGFTIARIPDPIYGDAILLARDQSCAVEGKALLKTAEDVVTESGISAHNVVKLMDVNTLPTTPTGKVVRKQLVTDYIEQQPAPRENEATAPDDSGSQLDRLLALYQQVFTGQTVTADESLLDIGADSIASVEISIGIDKILGYLPRNWRELSIEELAQLAPSTPQAEQAAHFGERKKSGKARPLSDGSSNQNPSDIRFWALVKEDFYTHEKDLFSQGFWAIFWHRFGNWRMGLSKPLRMPMTLVYRFMRKCVQILCGIKLDYTVQLGRRVKLEHFGGMILGARAIGDDVIIRQNTTFGIRDLSDLAAKPTIEAGVNIGAGAVIVGDVVVGRHSVIGPNAVVDRDIPPFSIVSGNPCQIVSR